MNYNPYNLKEGNDVILDEAKTVLLSRMTSKKKYSFLWIMHVAELMEERRVMTNRLTPKERITK